MQQDPYTTHAEGEVCNAIEEVASGDISADGRDQGNKGQHSGYFAYHGPEPTVDPLPNEGIMQQQCTKEEQHTGYRAYQPFLRLRSGHSFGQLYAHQRS